MTDTPGWASPGNPPSPEDRESGTSGPTDRPGPSGPEGQPGIPPQDASGPKWAGEQPPPGQWSAPTGAPHPGQTPPPPPSGPGWGGQPGGYETPGTPGARGNGPTGWGNGWNNGWGGPPPAAKPGVIPLRPLGVGEILDGAVSTMRTYWRTVLGISLTVAVISQLAVVLLQGLVLKHTLETFGTAGLDNPSITPREALSTLGGLAAGGGLVTVIGLVANLVATALLTTVTSRAVIGREISAREAWRQARPQVPRLFGLLLLLGLITVGVLAVGLAPGFIALLAGSEVAGAALLVVGLIGAAVVAVWLQVRFSLASPALMLERQPIVKAMSRSTKLVRGSWWRISAIQLLAAVIAGVVSSLVVFPFSLIAMTAGGGMPGMLGAGQGQSFGWTYLIITGVGAVIGSTITLPLNAGVLVLLYIDQRIRREALDLDLARAADVPAPGATGAPGPVPGS
ncbi:glycerophosphoryl diester phosphodiesterase membrane domain-containing protein [Streptomyces sp. J2-1]|uniref:DUF7544 domain-containing protein n=1 Tax=Streptomyces corallincola TaxID=2851888 RepID=UPI001C3917EC|nr:glycerophosphoryl diester phosphodiesterase membrane domain-containing protein [Streptomyces corallincola]MBV2354305.1 glycerophosphoryl diester phosphodiesterase membrane domain-containing protein [Streptomyces corallincola]